MRVAETLPCLVVGAGPTGLALAAQLRWFGCASASSGSIEKFKIMCRDGKGFWHGVRWDNKTASLLALQETDERPARKMLEQKSENPGGTAVD